MGDRFNNTVKLILQCFCCVHPVCSGELLSKDQRWNVLQHCPGEDPHLHQHHQRKVSHEEHPVEPVNCYVKHNMYNITRQLCALCHCRRFLSAQFESRKKDAEARAQTLRQTLGKSGHTIQVGRLWGSGHTLGVEWAYYTGRTTPEYPGYIIRMGIYCENKGYNM